MDFSFAPELLLNKALETGFAELPILGAQTLAVRTMPWQHRDPFERLLVAQALSVPAWLYTADETLLAYFRTGAQDRPSAGEDFVASAGRSCVAGAQQAECIEILEDREHRRNARCRAQQKDSQALSFRLVVHTLDSCGYCQERFSPSPSGRGLG